MSSHSLRGKFPTVQTKSTLQNRITQGTAYNEHPAVTDFCASKAMVAVPRSAVPTNTCLQPASFPRYEQDTVYYRKACFVPNIKAKLIWDPCCSRNSKKMEGHVCIPVVCVPLACCPYLSACTAQGGVSAPAGGGAVSGPGGCLVQGVCLLGGVCSGGVSQHALRQTPPPREQND